MTLHRLLTGLAALLVFVGPAAGGQGSTVNSAQAMAFIGTWIFDMTEPAELIGTNETVRIWEKNGVVAASVQVGKFPPNDVTGILKDGDLLFLTTTLRENGQPIWVVISLKREGETMMLAQMMEPSQTIKRGKGKKRVD
jgi:hypothetical protein